MSMKASYTSIGGDNEERKRRSSPDRSNRHRDKAEHAGIRTQLLYPKFPWTSTRVVQNHDRRVPAPEPTPDGYHHTYVYRLGDRSRVHLHPSDGAQMLPAAARRIDRARSGRHGVDQSCHDQNRDRERVRRDPPLDLHGRWHLLHERALAVHLHQAPFEGALEDAALVSVQLRGGILVSVSRRPDGHGSRDQRRRRVLLRLSPGRFRQGLQGRPRARRGRVHR